MPIMINDELRLRLSATEAYIPAIAQDMGNPSWDAAKARVLILRLSPFRDIEGSTSHLVLFSECRKALPEAYLDFGFFPDKRDKALLGSRGLPYFYGIESGRESADFDLILVSNAFALELVNLAYLFSTSGLGRRASERARAGGPIVILGGSNAASAGALLFPEARGEEASDCLVDGIFFGEGESSIGEIAAALTGVGDGASRAERLERASGIEGLWLALSGRPAARKILRPYPPQLLGYPVLNSEGASTARIQISAGCPGFCSFCLEGWESRPYRELPVQEIARAARELKARTGASVLEIYSYNFNTHSAVFELIFELGRIFRRVNFMSQRLDILAESPHLAGAEIASDKRSFTLGIEGISDRMRRYYRKGIDERQVDAAIGRLAIPAVREIKLFYIVSGMEDERDVAEFAEFAHRTAETRRRSSPGQRIIVSAGYLARLPFTPLQYAPLSLDRDKLEAIAGRIEAACSAAGIEFRLATDFEEYYVDQLLALGGRTLAPWLERTPEAGIAYDGSLSRGSASALEGFADSAGLLDAAFLGEKPADWLPPLSFIDENGEALRKNYLLAAGASPKQQGLMETPKYPGAEWGGRLERLMAAKRGFASTLVRASLPRTLAGATEEYRSAWIMRALASASSEGSASVFDAEEALFAKGGPLEGMAERFWGLAYYRLRGPDPAKMAKAAVAAGFEPTEALPSCVRIRAELEAPAAFGREAEAALRSYLAEERVDFVETRSKGKDGAASRSLAPAARGAKKRILLEAEIAVDAETFSARLVLGQKAKLREALSRMDYAARRSTSLRILDYGD